MELSRKTDLDRGRPRRAGWARSTCPLGP